MHDNFRRGTLDKTGAIWQRNGKTRFSKTCKLRIAWTSKLCSKFKCTRFARTPSFFYPFKKPCQVRRNLQISRMKFEKRHAIAKINDFAREQGGKKERRKRERERERDKDRERQRKTKGKKKEKNKKRKERKKETRK